MAAFNCYKKTSTIIWLLLLSCISVSAQNNNPDLLHKPWKAYWITAPGVSSNGYGVYHFRKNFEIASKPVSFIIHVSGDNRYKLYVNGTLASLGPARSDLFHWNYETVDIAPYLRMGKNAISSVVWNDGDLRPESQISFRTAFILQGASATEEVINTDTSWKCAKDSSYQPLSPQLVYSYYVAGPGEFVDMRQSTNNWLTIDFNDGGWNKAQPIFNGLPKGAFAYTDGWMLVPRPIPALELSTQRLSKVRSAEGISLPASFPENKTAITIPANASTTILLDQTFLTNAFPTLVFSKGKEATMVLGYAEALYINEEDNKDWRAQHQKGNRDSIEGKRFVGRKDSIISNGTASQQFTSLEWRTYRYLQLKITTRNEPLTIDDIYGTFVGYPFQLKAKFNTDDPELSKIMEVGWHTARLCAIETYMDCPYYEQLQYVGDTRIQGLISLYNSGDDRLMRNAINLIDASRMAEGLTLSRYPTASPQEIAPFSLWWIGMLHDYWMYRPDADFIKNKLPGMRQVLWFFSQYQQKDGSLRNLPYWSFTDWAEGNGWHNGIAPMGKDGSSASLDLQLLWAYQIATELESKLGMQAYATQYKAAADILKATIRKKYWDAGKHLFADVPEKDLYSQHVNALAILTGMVTGTEANGLAKKILTDTSLTPATIYFKYYVHQALIKAGLGNDYLNWLDVWHQNLKMGMTTWAEISDINNTRSDCHAWGAHPNIEFLRTVLGMDTDAPGFGKVKIEPHLGTLKSANGEMPHPNGMIKVQYRFENNKWVATIELPKNTPGYLLWKGKRYELKTGQKNVLTL